MYDFGWVIFQDFFLTPLLFMLLQFILAKIAFNASSAKQASKTQIFMQKKLLNNNIAILLAPNPLKTKKITKKLMKKKKQAKKKNSKKKKGKSKFTAKNAP